jgi:hypothetical protein
MIEILLKCETADEAQMYLEAPKVRGAADDFAYWLRNKIKHGDHTEEEHALLEEVSEEFYDKVGGML